MNSEIAIIYRTVWRITSAKFKYVYFGHVTYFIVRISDGHRGYGLCPLSLCFALVLAGLLRVTGDLLE